MNSTEASSTPCPDISSAPLAPVKRGHVAVIGSLNMDLVVRSSRLARPGETLAGQSFTQIPGGKGANQAVAAARLGAHVAMVGRLGQDSNGAVLRQALQEEGIDCGGVGTDAGLPTGVALIVVDDAGQNAITIVAGSNGALSRAIVMEHIALIDSADVVVCQMEVPPDTVLASLQAARAAGKTVVLNPAPVAGPLSADWLDATTFVIPNETEAEALTGIVVNSPASALLAARALRENGAHDVLITLGGQGVFWLPEGAWEGRHFSAHRVEVRDTTAAGDTFVGGFAAALAAGNPADAAIAFGLTAAALSVTRAGAQTSIPTLSELTSFLDRQK